MGVGNMTPEEARYLYEHYEPESFRKRSTPRVYGPADFPSGWDTDRPPISMPSSDMSYNFDGLEQRRLPPSSASLEEDLYAMLNQSAQDTHALDAGFASDQRDRLLGLMVPEAGGVRSGGYLNELNDLTTGNIGAMNDLQLAGIADLLAAQQAGAQGVHGAVTSGATGRQNLIGGQQDARMGRVGGQIDNYESMMLGGYGEEETAALDYLSGAEDIRRGMSADSRRESVQGYEDAKQANIRRQNNLAQHLDPMVSAAGAETTALLSQSANVSLEFQDMMIGIDEQIAIDRALGVKSEFSKVRLQLKHDVWNARTRLENSVADTKDAAALQAFDTIAAADASLAVALGAAGIQSTESLNAVAQATLQQKNDLSLAMSGAQFQANESFAVDKYEADKALVTQIDTIKAAETQGKIGRAEAREQMLAAKAKEQQSWNLKMRRGEETAKYLGFPPEVAAAWGGMSEAQQKVYIETLTSGDITVPLVINGETVDVTMSPEAYFEMEDRNTGRALQMAEQQQDAYEFEQSSLDDMDLIEQLMAAGVPINSETLKSILDIYAEADKAPPTDLLLAMLEGDSSLQAEAQAAEVAAGEQAQRQALIDSIVKDSSGRTRSEGAAPSGTDFRTGGLQDIINAILGRSPDIDKQIAEQTGNSNGGMLSRGDILQGGSW